MSMQQITPYYPPSNSDQRSYYNSNPYYSGYGLPPTHAPPHPDASVYIPQPQLDSSNNSAWGFASPPPPTLHEVYSEFGSPPSTSSTTVDLLDTSTSFQPVAYLPPQESRLTTPTSQQLTTLEDIPSDIIASQERALAEAKQRAQTRSSTSARHPTTSDALVPAVPVIPASSNPTGSDAVHPNRLVWKQTRGSKTVAGAAGGAIVGGVMFGPAFPVGMVLGGAAGGYVTNKLSKCGERRAQRKWEQSNFQRIAAHSQVADSTMV